MAYIEVRTTLPGHRKVAAASRRLGIPRPAVIGHLVCLWAWALENIGSSGSLAGITSMDLAHAAGWPAKQRRTADRFVRDLVETGWISDEDGELFIHDWADYAGRLLTKREADAARKRQERADSRSNVTGVRRTSDGRPADAPTPVRRTSAASRAPARGRTAPHRTAPSTEPREAPPARAREAGGRAAGASLINLDRPDVGALRDRGWKRLSTKQLAMLDEIAWRQCDGDPEQRPAALDSGRAWSGEVIAAAPKGAKLLEHLVETENQIRAERTAAAEADDARRRTAAADTGPIAASLAARIGSVAGNGISDRISHEAAVEQLRAVRGQVPEPAWTSMLERYHVSEEDLEDPVDFTPAPAQEAP